MSSGSEEMLDKVVLVFFSGRFTCFHALESFASARLSAVFAGERPLDIAAVGNGDEV